MQAQQSSTFTACSEPLGPSLEEHAKRLEAFSEYWKTSQKLRLFLENTEKFHQSVRPHIYERVRNDYRKQMQDAEKWIEQERSVLKGAYQNLTAEKDALQITVAETTDRLEEMDFRHRVGEYSEQEITKERTALKNELLKHTERMSQLETIIANYVKANIINDPKPGQTPIKREHYEPAMETISNDITKENTDTSPVAVTEEMPSFLVAHEGVESGEDLPVIICPENFPREDISSKPVVGNAQAEQASSLSYVKGYITALDGSRKGERFPLICSTITLGSSLGIDIRLNDPGIANFHARVVYNDHRYFLENFDGMGRCYVNGVHTGYSELKDGDIIRLGEIKLRMDLGAPPL